MESSRYDHDFVAGAYAPPQSGGRALVGDFREDAATFSSRLLAESFGRSPTDLGQSLCIPIENPADLEPIKWSLLLRLAFGVGGLILGGIIAGVSQYLTESTDSLEPVLIGLGVVGAVGGIGVLLTVSHVARSFARRRIGDRYEAVWRLDSPLKPLGVAVEDASTFQKLKLVPEDLAWIGFDVARRIVMIEGICYRYLIHAADLINIEQLVGPASTGVGITYRVGPTTLRIALQYDSNRNELRKQIFGIKHDLLMKSVTETLVEQATLV